VSNVTSRNRRRVRLKTAMLASVDSIMAASGLCRCKPLQPASPPKAIDTSSGLPSRRRLDPRAFYSEILCGGSAPCARDARKVQPGSSGFSEQSHFICVFGSVVGTSPAAWQRHTRI
jgi:hypothetical protein